jgi:hypothetical protein
MAALRSFERESTGIPLVDRLLRITPEKRGMSNATARETLEMLKRQQERIHYLVKILLELGFDPGDLLYAAAP